MIVLDKNDLNSLDYIRPPFHGEFSAGSGAVPEVEVYQGLIRNTRLFRQLFEVSYRFLIETNRYRPLENSRVGIFRRL